MVPAVLRIWAILTGSSFSISLDLTDLARIRSRRPGSDQEGQDPIKKARIRSRIGIEGLFETAAAKEGLITRQAGNGANFKIPAARLDIRKNSFAVRSVRTGTSCQLK
jgi:hypothetical protein